MLRASYDLVRIRRRAFVTGIRIERIKIVPVIIDVSGLIGGPAIESGARSPHRVNALVLAIIVQRRDAAGSRAGVKTREAMPIPITHQVAGGRAETSGGP